MIIGTRHNIFLKLEAVADREFSRSDYASKFVVRGVSIINAIESGSGRLSRAQIISICNNSSSVANKTIRLLKDNNIIKVKFKHSAGAQATTYTVIKTKSTKRVFWDSKIVNKRTATEFGNRLDIHDQVYVDFPFLKQIESGEVTSLFGEDAMIADQFFQLKNALPYYEEITDNFSGRIHTCISRTPSKLRKYITIDNERTISIDIKASQLKFLGLLIGSKFLLGSDPYQVIANDISISRAEVKKQMFPIVFSQDPESKTGAVADWLKVNLPEWNKLTGHAEEAKSNVAYQCQVMERSFVVDGIHRNTTFPTFTVHDSISAKQSDLPILMQTFQTISQDKFGFVIDYVIE
jgi:hypothetical protein